MFATSQPRAQPSLRNAHFRGLPRLPLAASGGWRPPLLTDLFLVLTSIVSLPLPCTILAGDTVWYLPIDFPPLVADR